MPLDETISRTLAKANEQAGEYGADDLRRRLESIAHRLAEANDPDLHSHPAALDGPDAIKEIKPALDDLETAHWQHIGAQIREIAVKQIKKLGGPDPEEEKRRAAERRQQLRQQALDKLRAAK